MTWEKIRTQFPDKWVLMESLESHMEGDKHIFEELSVIDTVDGNADIFPRYNEYKKRFPQREILFIHGSRVDPDVRVINRFGVRVCNDSN